jgi:hypothetical protein
MSGHNGRGRSALRMDVVQALEPTSIDECYAWYREAFEPLLTAAAGRHMLTPGEFAAEMADERIDKYVARVEDRAVGLTTLTNDLTSVPWIEPVFYLDRYPDEAARGALFYLGFTLIDPSADTFGVFKEMMDAFCRRVTAVRGVCGFDFCDYNARRAVGRIVPDLVARFGAPVEEVDSLQYFETDFSGAAEHAVPHLLDTQRYFVADFRRATVPDAPGM